MARAPRRPAKGLDMPPSPVEPSTDGAGPQASPPGVDGTRPDRDRVLDAAFRLFGERGWRNTALADVATAADVSLSDLYSMFPSKRRLLAAFSSRIDRTVLADIPAGLSDEPARDRIFDLLMRRFDALSPFRPAIRVLLREGPGDPLTALASGPRLLRSMGWTLEAAGIGTQGLSGLIRAKMLTGVYLCTLRSWLDDESGDLSATMAALDRNLGRVQRVFRV